MNLQQVPPLSNPSLNNFEFSFRQLLQHCFKIYQHSAPPVCIQWEKSFLKEGGSDPLRYIYIYKNNGDTDLGIPRHWHYIGFGLSDIHGYKWFCLLHEQFRRQNDMYAKMTTPMPELYPAPEDLELNGFGFELTFRLKCDSDHEWNSAPPSWPRKIMQDLARYVFQTRNTFSVGDHAAWHGPLDTDGQDQDSSRIKHLLMTLDPQLQSIVPEYNSKSLGAVTFIQMVGVCDEELQAAREWNVGGILDMMRESEETGGQFLVTDMRRGQTIFESNPENSARVEAGIDSTGSNMVQVTVKHKSSYTKPKWFIDVEKQDSNGLAAEDNMNANIEFDYEDCAMNDAQTDYPVRTPSRMSQGSESALRIENVDFSNIRYHQSIYILLSEESAKFLPIMLKGRLAHKRPFHFQSFRGDSLITFQPEGNPLQSLVNSERPFAKQGIWLQIYVSNELREQMWESIGADFTRTDRASNNEPDYQLKLPKNYSWPEFNLYITVVREL